MASAISKTSRPKPDSPAAERDPQTSTGEPVLSAGGRLGIQLFLFTFTALALILLFDLLRGLWTR